MAGSIGARWKLCWLLFLTRGVCQGNRVLLGALLPFLSADVQMSAKEKGSVLAAFSTGYMLTQILGGSIADRFGGKALVLFAITMMSIGSLVAPSLLAGGLGPFWYCYFFMGLAEGPSYPTTGSMLSKWIPAHERGAAVSIVDTGSSVASMCTFSISPLIATTLGWEFAFRSFGYCSLVICVLWAAFASNTPRDSPYISEEERKYLVASGMPAADVYGTDSSSSIASVSSSLIVGSGNMSSSSSREKKDEASLSSSELESKHLQQQQKRGGGFPFFLFGYSSAWATIAAHAAFNFGRYFVYNQIVTFYVEVVGTTAIVAGQQVLLGQIADTIGKFAFAPFVDSAIKRHPASKTRVRKLVSGLSFIVFAVCMVAIATSKSLFSVTTALVICKIASSAHVCGFKTSFLDLTTTHTGALTGVSNTIATLAAMISPLISGSLLSAGPQGWVHTFFLIAATNVAACFIWVTCFSAESLDNKLHASTEKKANV